MMSKYELQGIIQARKESMFEDELLPPEEETTCVNYETYKKLMPPLDEILYGSNHAYRAFEAIEFLIEKTGLKYFLTYPVGLFNRTTVSAKILETENFLDVFNIFKNNNPVIFYDLIYIPSVMEFHGLNSETFEHFILDMPLEKKPYWLLRYVVF